MSVGDSSALPWASGVDAATLVQFESSQFRRHRLECVDLDAETSSGSITSGNVRDVITDALGSLWRRQKCYTAFFRPALWSARRIIEALLQAGLMSYHMRHGTAFSSAPSCADHRKETLSVQVLFSHTIITVRSIFFPEFYLDRWLPLLRVHRTTTTWQGSRRKP